MRRNASAALLVLGSAFAAALAPTPAFAQLDSVSLVPRAVTVARTTTIPTCTMFVDAAATRGGDGSVQKPHRTIAAAAASAQNGAVICVAEGTYAESLKPGEKSFTLAGGFQSGKEFKVRDSARYVTRAKGNGTGSFLRIEDPGPKGDQLTAIDGFDISGYSQAIVRDFYVSQKFDLTNNHIHDNKCSADTLAGAGFALTNVTGRIAGNVIKNNACGRGGAGALVDSTNENSVTIERNLVEANAGTEKDSAHGGAFYFFGKNLTVTGNLFVKNTVTQWGAGLFIGAYTAGNQFTNARLAWNVYRDNRAGNAGGGLFCDDGATCTSTNEIFDRNCGGNLFLDGGPGGSGPTRATFDHFTNVGARAVGCGEPGAGVQISKNSDQPDTYAFTNGLFWGNAPGKDFAVFCDESCSALRVSISHSMVQSEYAKQNATLRFGDGIVKPADPLFADAAAGNFHLKSAAGRWTPNGFVKDAGSSPALGKSTKRTELGAYGNSGEASRVP